MGNTNVTVAVPAPRTPDPQGLDALDRAQMLAAAEEIHECYRVLAKAGLNIVGEVLRGEDEFIELDHYPPDDVFDEETHGQYYYHAHRSMEHGHFHTFMRAGGMPTGVVPCVERLAEEPWPQGDEAIAHLVGISMDDWGYPIGLFATNRWVTGETWYAAEAVERMVPMFGIDHAWPSWPVNRWITAMVRLFRPHVIALLEHRDTVIEAWQQAHPGEDVLEDRRLDITGYLPIDVDSWIKALERCAPR